MKTILLGLLTASLLATPIARAEDEGDNGADHAAHHAPEAQTAGTKRHDPAQHLRENMKTMKDVMARVRQSTDPEEKKRLLRVHMLAMQEQIRTMRATAGGHDHGAGGEGKEGKGGETKKECMPGAAEDKEGKDGETKKGSMMGGGMMRGGMMKMHKKMEQRMEALEQLIEQLIEHEAAEDDLGSR
jgi:hypothetical protein